jgi:hypothetical protein
MYYSRFFCAQHCDVFHKASHKTNVCSQHGTNLKMKEDAKRCMRRVFHVLAGALLIGVTAASVCWQSKFVACYHQSAASIAGATTLLVEEPAREADGCYHVFLDVGANLGVHGRFLLEPEKYPKAKEIANLFNSQFGAARDNRDFCTFEFEPNPAHQAALQTNSRAYKAVGWRYHVKNVGASDNNGTMDFYHQGDENEEEWGFSVKQLNNAATKVSIPVIRFSKWLEEHVNKRKIPSTPHGFYENSGAKVVMKMDVEGSEYVLLPDLILSGAICGIDLMFGEFHPHFAPLDSPGQHVPLETAAKAEYFGDALAKVISSSRNCKTVFQDLDSEEYLHDGMPLPVPNST